MRPLIDTEFGDGYYGKKRTFKSIGGETETCTVYRFRRDPGAAFSVLD